MIPIAEYYISSFLNISGLANLPDILKMVVQTVNPKKES